MSLSVLKKENMKKILTAMWKKELGTSKDPANGKWYENGAGGSTSGLYGGLVDTTNPDITFGTIQTKPPSTHLATFQVFDNLNGNMSRGEASLVYKYRNETTTHHEQSDTIGVGASGTYKSNVKIPIGSVEKSVTVSVDYAHSWTKGETTTQSAEIEVSQKVPFDIPVGKVYRVELSALVYIFDVDYTATINISGKTETWFEDRVNGHYNYSMSASEAFKKIHQLNHAGEESKNFSSQGYALKGRLTGQLQTSFTARIIDITSEYEKNPQILEETQSAMKAGTIVKEISFH